MATVLPTTQPTPIIQTKDYSDVLRDQLDAGQNALSLSRDCPVKCEVCMVPQKVATHYANDKLSREGLLQNQPESYVRTHRLSATNCYLDQPRECRCLSSER